MASPGYLDGLFAGIVDPSQVAGIVLELQAGEGGFIPAPPDTVRALAAFARQHGILLIIDEVQTGFGRTGKLFACEHYGIVPDLILTAKSLAGGLPLGAITGRAEIMDRVHPGGLGTTYGGNPLACAAALAVLEVMEQERLPERATRLGSRIRSCFCSWADQYQQIGDVRGLGAMMAMELVKDRATREPDPGLTKAVQAEALKRGLLLLTAGTYSNVLRVLVPLTVEDEVLEEGLSVMQQALRAATPD